MVSPKRVAVGAQHSYRALMALLVLVCVLLYGAGHNRYGLFDVDEAIFTQATIEMRATTTEHASGLVMPTYNGEPRYHKPPLIYWMQSLAMGALGERSLYAARLPSALAALMTILLLGYGIWRMSGDKLWALASSAILAFNLSFLVVGRAATADGLLNLTSLALALWIVAVIYGSRKARGVNIPLVNGLLAAMGFLAKGPVAWVPAAIIVLVVLAVRSDRLEIWRRLKVWSSLAVALLALSPWLLLLLWTHGAAFFYQFLIVENFSRYAGGLTNTQSSSPLYYLIVLAIGFFPWAWMLPVAVPVALRGWKKALSSNNAARALPVLAVAWAVVYILFFSASQTKLAHYIVPAYPALALVVGYWISRPVMVRMNQWWVGEGVVVTTLLALLCMVMGPLLVGLRQVVLTGWLGWLQAVLGFTWPPHDALAFAVLSQPVPMDGSLLVMAIILLGGVIPAWLLLQQGVRSAMVALAACWAVCLGLVVWGVVPTVWAYTQAPLVGIADEIADYPAHVPVIHLGVHKPSVLYLSKRPFTKLEKALQLPDRLVEPQTLVFTEITEVPAIDAELAAQRKGNVVAQQCEGGYCLLVVGRLTSATTPPITSPNEGI